MINRTSSQTTQRKFFRITLLAVNVGVFLMLSIIPGQGSSDALCEVLSVKNNAWRTQPGSAVRASLRAGDILRKGDHIEVMQGNTLDLVFDKERLNIVRVEGGTSIEISDLFPTALELNKGKVYALLDNKNSDRRFKVMTPTAIAAVRGTQFRVSLTEQGSQITTYQGLVQVSGRNPLTRYETKDFILLKANQKTSVKASGQIAEPSAISDGEIFEAKAVKAQVDAAAKERPAQPATTTAAAANSTSTSSQLVPTVSKDKEEKPKEGKVIL